MYVCLQKWVQNMCTAVVVALFFHIPLLIYHFYVCQAFGMLLWKFPKSWGRLVGISHKYIFIFVFVWLYSHTYVQLLPAHASSILPLCDNLYLMSYVPVLTAMWNTFFTISQKFHRGGWLIVHTVPQQRSACVNFCVSACRRMSLKHFLKQQMSAITADAHKKTEKIKTKTQKKSCLYA